MQAKFDGRDHSSFGDFVCFLFAKTAKFPIGEPAQKIHANICRGGCECMETEFGKHDIPGFDEIATFHIWPNFHFGL